MIAVAVLMAACFAAVAAAQSGAVFDVLRFLEDGELDPEVVSETFEHGDFEYGYLADGTVCITDYTGEKTSLTIPSKLGGRKVTAIGAFAGSGCWELRSLTIPVQGILIGDGAFSGCDELRTVSIDSASYIGDGAFSGCGELKSATVCADIIGPDAFSDCGNLRTLNLKTKKKTLRLMEGAFSGCGVQKLDLSVPCSFGENAFSYCADMVSARVAATELMDGAFSDCDMLRSFELTYRQAPVTVGSMVCGRCPELGAVVLPRSVSSVGDLSFDGFFTVIFAEKGTPAAKYAEENDIRWAPPAKLSAYKSAVAAADKGRPWTCPVCGTRVDEDECGKCGLALGEEAVFVPRRTSAPVPAPTPVLPFSVKDNQKPQNGTLWGCDDYEELYDMYPDEFEDLDEAEEFWELNVW